MEAWRAACSAGHVGLKEAGASGLLAQSDLLDRFGLWISFILFAQLRQCLHLTLKILNSLESANSKIQLIYKKFLPIILHKVPKALYKRAIVNRS